MTSEGPTYVLDTGPLSHFAKSQWLGVLKLVLQHTQVVIPDVVEVELRNGAPQHVYLTAVLQAEWIETVSLNTPEQLSAFAHYYQRLVGPRGAQSG